MQYAVCRTQLVLPSFLPDPDIFREHVKNRVLFKPFSGGGPAIFSILLYMTLKTKPPRFDLDSAQRTIMRVVRA